MHPSALRVALRPLIAIMAIGTLVAMAGCAPKAPAKTAAKPATKPAAVATGSVTPTEPAPSVTPPVAPPTATGDWPAPVRTFASKSKAPVWYPTALPKGMKLDSVDVFEIEPGTGLVCDTFFAAGELVIDLLQGSPSSREYETESLGKVPWGTETADVVYEDPSDTAGPKMIVYRSKGTLAELTGGATFEQLKSVAASMVLVK
jgi:hypothetical protein